jgi:hypothetical protein
VIILSESRPLRVKSVCHPANAGLGLCLVPPANASVRSKRRALYKPSDDGLPKIDLAVPAFCYKDHIGIDNRLRLIQTWLSTDALRHDGVQLPALVVKTNMASDVWVDTNYRSKVNEKHLAENGLRWQIHRKNRPGPSHASERVARQLIDVESWSHHRARVCPAEGADGARRVENRSDTGELQDRHRQQRPQHEKGGMAPQDGGSRRSLRPRNGSEERSRLKSAGTHIVHRSCYTSNPRKQIFG